MWKPSSYLKYGKKFMKSKYFKCKSKFREIKIKRVDIEKLMFHFLFVNKHTSYVSSTRIN